MADLGHIQNLLNSDHAYRARFLKDPVGALGDQGLTLSNEMQQQLRRMVEQAQCSPQPVPGARRDPGGPYLFSTRPDLSGPLRVRR